MESNYAHLIVKNLEAKGESKDYIIGFLTATLNGVRHLESSAEILDYLERSVEQSSR